MTRATSSTQVGNRTAKWSTDRHETADAQVELGTTIRVLELTGVLLATLVLEYIDEQVDSRLSIILHLSIPDQRIQRQGSVSVSDGLSEIVYSQERYTKHDQRLSLFRSLPSNVEYGLFPSSLEPSIEVQRVRTVPARIRRLLAIKDIVRADVDQPEIQFGS